MLLRRRVRVQVPAQRAIQVWKIIGNEFLAEFDICRSAGANRSSFQVAIMAAENS